MMHMTREPLYDPVFDAQRHFRLLLDATARPGKLLSLNDVSISPPEGLSRAAALMGFALLDPDASFWMEAQHEREIEYLRLHTGARLTPMEEADFLFFMTEAPPAPIIHARVGSLEYPEHGASLVLQVQRLSEAVLPQGIALELQGPGVSGRLQRHVQGVPEAVWQAIQQQNHEYPLGVDTYLVDAQNQLMCLPRSNHFSILNT